MSERILIVEDEPLVALELKETLEDAGFEVPLTVDSADRVLQAVSTHRPSLILMDIRLRSFIDGVDVVARVRMMSPVPVIYLTAYSTPEVVHRAQATHPAAFLIKPIDGAALVKTVRSALQSSTEA
jgi:DNA-binding NarL/FixJ family response regulator